MTTSQAFLVAEHKYVIASNTVNFHKYIVKYLSLTNVEISEKFKYNLVVSNLLDNSLVLSKNEQALSNLLRLRDHADIPLEIKLTHAFNDDGSELVITNKDYRLNYPRSFNNLLLLVNIVRLIIFLLKQGFRSNLSYRSRLSMFKALIIMATKVVKYRRATTSIMAARTLRFLDDFLLLNCRTNKAIITSIIGLKEFELFFNKGQNGEELASNYVKELRAHLTTLLACMVLNVKSSIAKLFPLCNGTLLEKYCQINKVQLGGTHHGDQSFPLLESITETLNVFNNYRRLLVCQLLTFHENPEQNFFLLKLRDYFNCEPTPQAYVSSIAKYNQLELIFNEHTSLLKEVIALNDKFRHMHRQPSDLADNNILSSSVSEKAQHNRPVLLDTDLGLNNLIAKLDDISMSLKYFRKYSQLVSDVDDTDELEEKLSIFSSFNKEVALASELYNSCLHQYRREISERNGGSGSVSSNSQRNSYNSDNFGLKTFRTKTHQLLPQKLATDRKNKRFSSGLQLGLLTVFEGSSVGRNSAPAGPSGQSQDYDLYNQAALDALTKKSRSSNRYSVISMNSNVLGISDLIASTQITTEDEGPDNEKSNSNGLSKDELRRKLEESYGRVYSLDDESELKSEKVPSEIEIATDSGTLQNSAFLGDLDKALELRLS